MGLSVTRTRNTLIKNAYALISAAAVAAVMAAPVAAQQLPLNNAVSGGQGDVQLDGQVTAAAFGLSGTVIATAVVGALLIVTVVTDDGDEVTVTTSAP